MIFIRGAVLKSHWTHFWTIVKDILDQSHWIGLGSVMYVLVFLLKGVFLLLNSQCKNISNGRVCQIQDKYFWVEGGT